MTGYSIDVEALRKEIIGEANGETEGKNSSPAQPTKQALGNLDNKLDSSKWNLLSQAIDRILFILYTVIVSLMMVTYIGGIAVASSKAVGQ